MTQRNSPPRPPLTLRLTTFLLLLMVAPLIGQASPPAQPDASARVLTLQRPIQSRAGGSNLTTGGSGGRAPGLPQKDVNTVTELIQQLGHDSFDVRSRAARQLIRFGRASICERTDHPVEIAAFTRRQLRAAGASVELERSIAATRLIDIIDAQTVSRQLDAIRRGTSNLDASLTTEQHRPGNGRLRSPGIDERPGTTVAADWRRAAAQTGTDAIARHAFTDLYVAHATVFATSDTGDWHRRAADLVATWPQSHFSQAVTPTDQIAVLLACLNEPRPTPAALSLRIATELARPITARPQRCDEQRSGPISSRDPTTALLNRLACRWLATRASGIQISSRIEIATSMNDPAAVRSLTDQLFCQPHPRPAEIVAAVLACEAFAGGLPTDYLNRCLDDRRIASVSLVNRTAAAVTPADLRLDTDSTTNRSRPARPGRSRIVTQVRDVALALSLRRSGIDPREAGFRYLRADQTAVYAADSLGFEDDSQRNQAHARIRR